MSQLTLLYRYASPCRSLRTRVLVISGLLLLALVFALGSPFVISSPFGITPEHVGGTPLEITFWLTALFASFLSFYMSELFFRSPDVRLLAQLPVSPIHLFFYRLGVAVMLIGSATLPVSALLFELWRFFPLHAALCTGLFFMGSLLCVMLSTAILMYAGNSTVRTHDNPAFTAQSFMMAPAVSLFVSLISALLLKLLVEALLKPGHLDAALTAAGITGVFFVISVVYALRAFQKNYYAVLSNFMDNDALMLNADYRFVDETTLKGLQAARTPQAALTLKNKVIVSRRHTLSRILVITVSVILGLVGISSPDTLSGLNRPPLAISLCFMLAPVWLWLSPVAFDRRLPVPPSVHARARYRAACFLAAPNMLALTAALSLPLFSVSWKDALCCAVTTLFFMTLLSAIAVWLVHHRPARAGLFSWTVAGVCAIASIIQ